MFQILIARGAQTLALLSLFILNSLGQTAPSQSVVFKNVSPDQLRPILQRMQVGFTEEVRDGVSFFHLKLDNYAVTLVDQGNDLQLYIGFSDKVPATKVNSWNQKYRFSRAYVNENGNPFVESDLDVRGGVTEGGIEAFVSKFRTTVRVYSNFLSSQEASEAALTGAPVTTPAHRKSASATRKINAPFGNFALWIDESKWRTKPESPEKPGQLTLDAVNGEASAVLMSERISVPTDSLGEIALANAQRVDPNAKIVLREKRIVNGREVLVLQMTGTLRTLPFRYYGYFYGGTSGTIQLITFTVSTMFDRNVEEFTRFLDGLEITDQELPSAPKTETAPTESGLLLLNSGGMGIRYDPNKWKQSPTNEQGRYLFRHAKGDGYAMVISERLSVPIETLPDITLQNIHRADPNATVVDKEKRRISGADVWFLKIEVVAKGIPLTYYDYLYSGPVGTVQIMTYTGKNLVSEYDSDFLEFLNGFQLRAVN